MKISFYGAARTVTGSCHMLSCVDGNILIDCGMRQGQDVKGEYGEDRFPFEPEEIKYVLLTHAHIDHSGLIPLLVKRGFTGTVLCTTATEQLSTIMLPDSGHIQEQEAEWQSRKNERAGKSPVDPLYTVKDAQAALKQFRGVNYGETVALTDNVQVRFSDVGHLLGSAAIEVFVTEGGKTQKILFSGDVGRSDRPILRDPTMLEGADYMLLEGTYGDRNHVVRTAEDRKKELENVIRGALARGGNLVIPSFAVGRTQELLYYIRSFLASNAVPGLERVPVYIDSPLGIEATKIYERCAVGYYDEESMALLNAGTLFEIPTLRIAQTVEESKLINEDQTQKIIISSSGMCDAGRIRHHLKHNLYRADSTILFAGYQAVGTLGRALVDGASKVRLFGEDVRVNADIVQVDGFSGHAGRDELIEWALSMKQRPQQVFLVHGEEKSLLSLGEALSARGMNIAIPDLGDVAELVPGKHARRLQAPAEAKPVAEVKAAYADDESIKRVEEILLRAADRRSPDMDLMRKMLNADIKALADKWDALIGK